jgi:hypothetical protein
MSIFVSYAHQDQKWAKSLISMLVEKGVDVWDAPSKLAPGDNWPLEVGKALERAEAMIVLVSPAATRSQDVQREIGYALSSERFHDRLIPIIVKPTEKIPWILAWMKPMKGNDPMQVSDRVMKRLKISTVSD